MSGHQHISDDVFIDALYGVSAIDIGACDIDASVRECPVCAERWNALQERRGAITEPLEIGADVLAAQRAKIYRRIESPSLWEKVSDWTGPLVAGAAAACLLALGVLVHNSATPLAPAHSAAVVSTTGIVATAGSVTTAGMSDTQLYSDVYAMEQSFEPSTASSIRILFERDGAASDSRGTESNLEQ